MCSSKRKWARCGAGGVVVLGLKLVDFLGPAEDRYDRSGADLRRRISGMVADDYWYRFYSDGTPFSLE